ncbi:bluetail domain-containing putative surface protein [Acidovorax sp. LjRoot118]|uniref:bluetail domain-containing putative surface protein n=1 Tax=Acidovorax sp. LjRoot118 TaxID=3342256 RepID=UPI003F4F5BB3
MAARTAGANKAIAFGYGGDTYILVNDATAALGSQDGLVRLNGVPVVRDGDWSVV